MILGSAGPRLMDSPSICVANGTPDKCAGMNMLVKCKTNDSS